MMDTPKKAQEDADTDGTPARMPAGSDIPATPKGAEPSERQRRILDAYDIEPNAAAVARKLNTNEGHVRRLVKEHQPYLVERRRARDAELLEKESARRARMQGWLDTTLEADLARLDELTHSTNELVALRAIKEKWSLSATVSSRPMAPEPSVLDASLADIEAALMRRLDALAPGDGALDG